MLILLLAWGAGIVGANEPPVVRIGVLAYRGPAESVASWSELSRNLASRIPGYRFEQVLLDGPSLREAVRNERLDFILTNPSLYVSLAAEFGVRRLATVELPESLAPEKSIGSTVVVRADRRDIKSLADLRRKRIAAVAPDAFGGYLAAVREIHRAGVDLEGGDAQMVFVGFPQRLALDVLREGKVDAAIVRTCLLEQLAAREQLRPEDFRVLGERDEPGFRCRTSTPLYPDWAFAVTRRGDRDLAKAVSMALLSLPAADNGLVWGVPADYQAVHDLFKEQMTGPYADLATTTVRGLLRHYRPYVVSAIVLLLGFLAHVIRVEYLVARRTTALRRAEERARNLQQEAEHMARLSILGEMSGTLAHEINQPLATISTYAQSLQRRMAAGRIDAEPFAQAVDDIAAEAERAGEVVRRIRAFARKREGTRERRLLIETVREAVNLFSGMLPKLSAVIVADELPGAYVYEADHLQIQQVILNLLKNAADAMADMPLAERRIHVQCQCQNGRVRLCVADRGPPVAAETMARLFEPFFTTKGDGLGLGLAICKSIAEAHGGRLTVEACVPPPGLAFCLSLPEHD